MDRFDAYRGGDPVIEALIRFTKEVTKVAEELHSVVETLHKHAWAIYEDVGCPYGRNRAGLKLWMEETVNHVGDIDKRSN
jgi:hypothetical protein